MFSIALIVLMYVSSLFLGLQIMYKYFYFQLQTQTNISKTLPANPIDMIANDTLLSIVSILVIFAGLLGYIFHKIVRRDLMGEVKRKVHKLAMAERKASKAENSIALSLSFGALYYKDKERYVDFLDMALKFDERAFKTIDGLDKKNYGDVILNVKNNLAYSLADRQARSKLTDQKSKERAMKIKDELWEMIITGEIEKYDNEVFSTEETCAWITYCFAENEAEKENARQIIKNLEGRYPLDRYENIKKKYSLY